eukprot:3858648-Rhodomonas_salina.2
MPTQPRSESFSKREHPRAIALQPGRTHSRTAYVRKGGGGLNTGVGEKHATLALEALELRALPPHLVPHGPELMYWHRPPGTIGSQSEYWHAMIPSQYRADLNRHAQGETQLDTPKSSSRNRILSIICARRVCTHCDEGLVRDSEAPGHWTPAPHTRREDHASHSSLLRVCSNPCTQTTPLECVLDQAHPTALVCLLRPAHLTARAAQHVVHVC